MQFRIREARIAAGMTQKELADRLGIKDATLSGYETGAHDPKSDKLVEIAHICGTTVDYLLGIDRAAFAEEAPAAPDPLPEEEAELLTLYRALNADARRMLIQQARMYATHPDMQKDGQSNAGTA